MAAKTAAQEEFDSILASASTSQPSGHHPGDLEDYKHDRATDDLDEEEEHTRKLVDENMRMPSFDPRAPALRLPHRDFDDGRTTGVKGVIADARSYEEARLNLSWRNKPARGASGARPEKSGSNATFLKDEGEGSDSEDEEFLERWRQSRREELQREGNDIRNRRTSPSVRRYGRFDEVDALGYLDAIEKVTRDTVVLVFVYDEEVSPPQSSTSQVLTFSQCPVSQIISDALSPLVPANPSVHFVRVHYAAIEFDNAGVPAILAYKNQGDLFANLTYIIDQIPEDTLFDSRALANILRKHQIL